MAIITLSGRAVKRPSSKTLPRRAKAPAPWAGWNYRPTEAGLAASQDGDPDERELTEAVLAIGTDYEVTRDGDHLRFRGNTVGNYARVSIPGPGEKMFSMLGSQAGHPAAAFEVAAALYLATHSGAGERI